MLYIGMIEGEKTSRDTIFYALLGLYGVYAIFYIARTSFIIDGERYFSLFDDAMISMRYARNLVDGHGLVFNPGGPAVEGFTNPLWVFFMALIHLLPIAQSKISLVFQVAGAALGFFNLILVRKLADYFFDSANTASLVAVCLTAFYLPLNTWNLQGMEVSALTCLVTGTVLISVRCMRTQRCSAWLVVLLGVAVVIRIDMVIPVAVITGFILFAVPEYRRKNLLLAVLIVGSILALQTGLRWWYYGDILPNTYYLKMTGYPALLRIARGFEVVMWFILHMYVLPFVIAFSILLIHRRREILLLFGLFVAEIAYTIYIGGDSWEWWGGANRFLSMTMPLFFILFAVALMEIISHTRLHTYRIAATTVLTLVSLLAFNSLRGPSTLAEWVLVNPPLHAIDNANMVSRAKLVKRITTPDASIAVTWAGAIPYFADRHTIDILGKTDATIARMRVDTLSTGEYPKFEPGHIKRDYSHSLGKLRPDVIVQIWGSAAEASDYIEKYYQPVSFGQYQLCLRTASKSLIIDEIRKAINR